MINTVLCIGASTYSEETPENINEALTNSHFLEKGSVILAFHLYFVLYPEKNGIIEYPPNHFFGEEDLKNLKDFIQNKQFPNCKDKIVFIDREGQHPVEEGFIYILPDFGNLRTCNSEFPPLEAFLDEVDDNLVIQCFDRNYSELYPEYVKHILNMEYTMKYRPCIDLTMERLANSKVPNKLGLILAGRENDGAKGLTSIGLKGGNIAIQNPDTYQQYVGNYDMPNAAILEAKNKKVNHELISLYGENDNKSLTTWLCEQLS